MSFDGLYSDFLELQFLFGVMLPWKLLLFNYYLAIITPLIFSRTFDLNLNLNHKV